MANAREQSPPLRAKTLEYRQAMKDFHVMFPTLERDIIECVLRSNGGHVDSTIDQLLQLSQDTAQSNHNGPSLERLYYTYDDSSESSESFPSEHRAHLTSSDEDQPPKYTPSVEPPPSPYTFSSRPVESASRRRYRDWNPPMLGTLPDDFLRILPSHQHRRQHQQTSSSPMNRHQHHNQHFHASGLGATPSSSSHRGDGHLRSGGSHRSHSPPLNRHMQRRKTTGEVNVKLGRAKGSQRSPHLRRMVRVESSSERSSRVQPHSAQPRPTQRRLSVPTPRARARGSDEQSQYEEDRKVALLLQNEEFLRELRRNEQFLNELNQGNSTDNNGLRSSSSPRVNSRDKFQPISVDPFQELPANSSVASKSIAEEPVTEDKEFKESLKHMNKSAWKSFVEIAKKFQTKRKSYKSMNDTIDPVFANCDDEQGR